MDFSYSDDQQTLRKEIIRFAQNELNDSVSERDRNQEFPHELWLKCGEMGFQGLPVGEEYGGGGWIRLQQPSPLRRSDTAVATAAWYFQFAPICWHV
jgi:alkylation response protein AidB-like acyl-CoA dehydrogenase